AFVRQVNEILLTDSSARQNHELLTSAKHQLDYYLNITESMELLQASLAKQTSLVPINPAAIAQTVAGSVRPRLQRTNHSLTIYSDDRAVALGDKLALANILKALIRLSEATSRRASQINLEILSRSEAVQIKLTSKHSSLTRPQ